jgi:hypothetical protein
MDLWRSWHSNDNQVNYDVANYYSYLPAFFNNNGSFEFKNSNFNNYFLPKHEKTNKFLPKTTYGLALLYSPLYALGYKIAVNQKSAKDGFSEPFYTVLHWGTILYALLGLLLLRNFLIKFYTEKITAITLVSIFFGTTLFFYSVSMPELPHSNLFFLFSAFLLSSYHWYNTPNIYRSVLLGLLIGLISVIRPTDVLIVILFIFWPIENKVNIKEKLLFFKSKWKYILIIVFSAFVVWIPQILFWKSRTGNYLYFSYPGEKFFWLDPQIINVLFSFRKGLFIYTPLILFSFIGLFFMKERTRSFRATILVLFILTLYIISCWWDWFFGGCYGARAFVQHFSYLSIPLASFFSFFFEGNLKSNLIKLSKLLIVIIFSCGISLNLFQTYQYVNYIIHFNGMSKGTYWLIFRKAKLNELEQSQFWNSLKNPDYNKLKTGEDRDQ